MRRVAVGLVLVVASCGGDVGGQQSTAVVTTTQPAVSGCPGLAAPPEAIVQGQVDIDDDGTPEVWATVGSGAAATIWQLFTVTDSR